MSGGNKTVADVIAETIGYDRPRQGLIGSGLSRMLAYQRASDICKALGLPHDLGAETLRRWGNGAVVHLGPNNIVNPVLASGDDQAGGVPVAPPATNESGGA